MSTEKEAVEIVTTPDVLHGQPRLDGTRIGVHMLGEMIRDGEWTTDEVVAEYPELSHEHVEAALTYYDDHPEEMAALTEERESLTERLRRESGV